MSGSDLRDQRVDYSGDLLPEPDGTDPFSFFGVWMDAALAEQRAGRLEEPTAMALSTAAAVSGESLRVSSRMVLLKSWDEAGFVFFSHYDSVKGQSLAVQPQASLLLWWPSLHRQVRIEGAVGRVDRAESEDYFAVRPRGSQLGVWASRQSHPRSDRHSLMDEVAAAEQRFAGTDVPCPDGWGGFRLVPDRFEFWQGQPSRLHDRLEWVAVGTAWQCRRLDP